MIVCETKSKRNRLAWALVVTFNGPGDGASQGRDGVTSRGEALCSRCRCCREHTHAPDSRPRPPPFIAQMTTMFGSLWAVFLAVRCALLTLPWLLHLLISDILLSCLLPISAIAPDLAYNLSSKIAESVWHGIQLIFTRINGAKIVVSGIDALPPGESAIVVSNHVEWCDFYLIQELAIRRGMLSRCRYFAKQQLKWVPFLGWGLWAMGMPLVSRKWTQDQREMDRVFNGILQRRWPICETTIDHVR